MSKILLMLILLVTFNSCSRTVNAWKGSTPKEYLEIFGKDDLPLKLEAKHVEYRCVDLVYSSSGNTKKCYVTKNSAERVDGWVSRLYATSKGVLLDTGENIIILGMLGLCTMGGDCRNLDFSKIKINE